MVKLKHTFSALLLLALVSCVPPKAVVVEEPPPAVKKEKPKEPVLAEAALPNLPDDGLRMGNMLELPSDREFRTANSSAVKTGTDAGAVIARPPTDPPSRVKPKADASGDQR
ncbi:MAG: hypothetical protein ABI600_18850 [Luteolibacter sp.]